jgi:hypothetical protein
MTTVLEARPGIGLELGEVTPAAPVTRATFRSLSAT